MPGASSVLTARRHTHPQGRRSIDVNDAARALDKVPDTSTRFPFSFKTLWRLWRGDTHRKAAKPTPDEEKRTDWACERVETSRPYDDLEPLAKSIQRTRSPTENAQQEDEYDADHSELETSLSDSDASISVSRSPPATQEEAFELLTNSLRSNGTGRVRFTQEDNLELNCRKFARYVERRCNQFYQLAASFEDKATNASICWNKDLACRDLGEHLQNILYTLKKMCVSVERIVVGIEKSDDFWISAWAADHALVSLAAKVNRINDRLDLMINNASVDPEDGHLSRSSHGGVLVAKEAIIVSARKLRDSAEEISKDLARLEQKVSRRGTKPPLRRASDNSPHSRIMKDLQSIWWQ